MLKTREEYSTRNILNSRKNRSTLQAGIFYFSAHSIQPALKTEKLLELARSKKHNELAKHEDRMLHCVH